MTHWLPSRREWLTAVAGGCAALACGDNRAERFGGLAVGVQSWSFRTFGLEEALAMAAQLGFVHVELTPGEAAPGHLPFPASAEQIAGVRALLAQHGLACKTAHIAPLGVDHPPDRAVFEAARALGVRTIMITEVSAELDALVAEFGLRAGLHNHTGSHYDTAAAIAQAIDGRDRRIGTIVDTGHYTRVGVDPVEALHAFGGRVYGVHLKDVAAPDPQAPDVVLGEGVLDLVGVVRAMREIGLPGNGTISIEYESNPFDPYADLARALDNLARAADAAR